MKAWLYMSEIENLGELALNCVHSLDVLSVHIINTSLKEYKYIYSMFLQ